MLQALYQLWKELSIALDEKPRNSKLRLEQLGVYEKLQDQVLLWLSNMESKINRLEPVAVEMETVKKQIEEIKVRRRANAIVRAIPLLHADGLICCSLT